MDNPIFVAVGLVVLYVAAVGMVCFEDIFYISTPSDRSKVIWLAVAWPVTLTWSLVLDVYEIVQDTRHR